MTDVVIDTQVLNTLEQLQDSGDTLLVTSSGSLNNLDSDGIISEADDQQISIYGLVFGDQGVTVTGNNVSVIVNGDVGGTLVGVFLIDYGRRLSRQQRDDIWAHRNCSASWQFY